MGVGLRYIFRRSHYEKIPDFEGGRVISSMHINGLVDPATLVHSQDRRIISMGRHDLDNATNWLVLTKDGITTSNQEVGD